MPETPPSRSVPDWRDGAEATDLEPISSDASHSLHLRSYLPELWKDGIARLSGGLGVALAFLAAYFSFIANHGIDVLWLASLIAFVFAGYRVWVAERRRYLRLYEMRGAEIRAYLESRLVIDFRPNESVFVQDYKPIKQYRVSVRSLIDVSNVELVVNHLKIGDFPAYHNLHLRPMHDRDTEQGTKRVKLHARKENYWDLTTEYGAAAMQSGRALVELNCIPALGKYDLPPDHYEFELLATGDGVPEATKVVRLTIRADEGVTSLEIRDGRLGRASVENLVIPISTSRDR